jgi:hypothetical protein
MLVAVAAQVDCAPPTSPRAPRRSNDPQALRLDTSTPLCTIGTIAEQHGEQLQQAQTQQTQAQQQQDSHAQPPLLALEVQQLGRPPPLRRQKTMPSRLSSRLSVESEAQAEPEGALTGSGSHAQPPSLLALETKQLCRPPPLRNSKQHSSFAHAVGLLREGHHGRTSSSAGAVQHGQHGQPSVGSAAWAAAVHRRRSMGGGRPEPTQQCVGQPLTSGGNEAPRHATVQMLARSPQLRAGSCSGIPESRASATSPRGCADAHALLSRALLSRRQLQLHPSMPGSIGRDRSSSGVASSPPAWLPTMLGDALGTEGLSSAQVMID